MKRILFIFVLVFSLTLSAQISEAVEVALAEEDEHLLYDRQNGVCQSNDLVFITYYRVEESDVELSLSLMLAVSEDGGDSFTEKHVNDFIVNYLLPEHFNQTYLPSVWLDENNLLHLFYLDPENGYIMDATTDDQGDTFTCHGVEGLPRWSQFKLIKTLDGLQFAALPSIQMPMSRFQYLSYYEDNENIESYDPSDWSSDIRFWGIDELDGLVYSNDDILVSQMGGGNNNGWPTFTALAATAGRFIDTATGDPLVNSAPMDQIFQGGYQEQTCPFEMLGGDIRANGYILDSSLDRDVLLAVLDGNTATCRYADYVTHLDTFTVYNSFPDPLRPNLAIGDSIWQNVVSVPELLWDDETFQVTVNDASVFVYCDLWIEGNVGSNMTWGCADTVYITSDICYSDIDLGDPAEDSQYLFGLVSEERIYYKYKYRDHQGVIHDDNCDGLYIYGSLAALGVGNFDLYGNMNTHYEGIITFEYQHGHGSTPSFYINTPQGDWFVQYPDLHKFIFPPDPFWTGDPGFQFHGNDPQAGAFNTCGYPYENPSYGDLITPPYGADYPFYNPVYPEAAAMEMGERGILHHYGGAQQRRVGYTHRSGSDPNNHPDDNSWDLDNWHYSGTHGSSGYDEDRQWDSRLDYSAPPDYPKIALMPGNKPAFAPAYITAIYNYDSETNLLTEIADSEIDLNQILLIDACSNDNMTSLLFHNYDFPDPGTFILSYAQGEWIYTSIFLDFSYLTDLEIEGNNFVLKNADEFWRFDLAGNPITTPDLNQYSAQADFTPDLDGVLHYIDGDFPIYDYNIITIPAQNLLGTFDYEFGYSLLPANSTIEVNTVHENQASIVLVEKSGINKFKTNYLYYSSADFSSIFTDSDPDEISVSPSIKAYPNPFNPLTRLEFNVTEPGIVDIAVYNIKGQKLQSLINEHYQPGFYSIDWSAPQTGSGIYLIRYILNGSVISIQKITMLK